MSYNALIDQIENDDPITCSRKCQNNLKVKNGMYFKCKSCEKVFLNFNPRKYRCDNCEKELDYLYENNFKKYINQNEIENWLKDKNIIKYFKNENCGSYYKIEYQFNNEILKFYYKVCVECESLFKIDYHINRVINEIENNNKFTFCNNNHQNKFLNKYKAENNIILCTCKRCKNDFFSNNWNTYFCEKCINDLEEIMKEIDNENNLIYDDWFENKINESEIEIIEEIENKYKIIKYKGFEFFFKKCYKCNRWKVQNDYKRTIEAIKNGVETFCSSNCRDEYYMIGKNYFKEIDNDYKNKWLP